MKIAIEVQRLFRPKKHGMEIVALELIRQIQHLDQENEYIVFAKDDKDRNCIIETRNLSVETLSSRTYADWEQISLPAAVKRIKPDFLHCTCNTGPLRGSMPLMLTLHDIIYLEKVDFKGTAYQNFGNLYRRYVVPKVVQKSKLVLTVSNYEKKVIIDKLGLPEGKVQVVYNAVNQRFNNRYDKSLINEFKKQYKLPDRFILFLGNTAPKKNTPNVIKAFVEYCREEKNPTPLVILDYDLSLVQSALQQLNAADCLKHIIFPGYIPSAEMPKIYNSASIFLYPSLRESFGLPILEAMGCGTPVITATTSSMPEVAGDAALLVDPYQPSQIASAIKKVLNDESLHRSLVQKGLSRAAEFTWEASAKRLLQFYQTMK